MVSVQDLYNVFSIPDSPLGGVFSHSVSLIILYMLIESYILN